MSLDLCLSDDDREIAWVNWARNPFGLCQWAMDNAEPGIDVSLHYVCNHWSYEKSAQVNRPMFKAVVDAYGAQVRALTEAHFWFAVDDYDRVTLREFQRGGWSAPTGMESMPYEAARRSCFVVERHGKLGIPMELFTSIGRHNDAALRLPYYKAWVGRLEAFAELLQDKSLRFECSN